jgi:phospho-N-acetylmuramoyl-pentapeptide-transferase
MLYGLLRSEVLRVALAFLTALSISLVCGAWLIRFFHRRNVIEDTTQPDHAGLNAIQSQKKNIPTMGGLMILAGIVLAVLLWSFKVASGVWTEMLVVVVLGGAGFVDDYIKLKWKPKRGLTKTEKLAVQFILGGLVGYLLMTAPDFPWLRGHNSYIVIPGAGEHHLGWLYVPWCGFVMAATSNAVNLTDGLDGLAGGLILIASLALCFYLYGTFNTEILCAAIAGGVLGFLWYNCHPAQIFMGDTGSLALGGLLAYAALASKVEFLLLIIGAVFFIEELTVAMQIASFKLTGKRIFPITPIHHYFQVNLKWPEQKIVSRAWIIGALFASLALVVARWGIR